MSLSPDSAQLRNDQLTTLLSGSAPTPTSTRFKPLRLGLMGIWQYGNEEFHFHDGRLILRGRNGSGKTKVLEVTSPFLLDANLSARRLDPFGNNARSMRENLLYEGRTHQIGYVWCEYGRIAEDGSAEYRTIGAGMRARETKSGVPESWYFITPLRVGVDFSLCDNADRPFDGGELAKRLGDSDDTVFTKAEDYLAKLARELFGLSPQRLHSLVELLIILRRPKLSENLSVERLKEILSNGLPPVDEELVAGLAKNFDELKQDEEDLRKFVKAQEEVDLFLDSYRVYARRMTRHITNDVIDAAEKHQKVLDRGERAARDLEKTEVAITETESSLQRLDGEQNVLRGKIRALESSPEMKNRKALTQLKSGVDEAAKTAESAKLRTARAANLLVTDRQGLKETADRLTEAHRTAAEAEVDTRTFASAAGLHQEFESEADRLRTDSTSARNTLEGYISARRTAVKETRRLYDNQQEAQATVNRVQAAHDDLSARRASAAEQVLSLESDFDDQMALLSQEIVSWSGHCAECLLTDEQITRLVEAAERVGDEEAPRLVALIAQHVDDARARLQEQRSHVKAELSRLASEHENVAAQREQVAKETYPPPPDPLVARRDRTGVPGAPLWRLVDFHPEVTNDVRAGVEAALLGSGLLDAWVTPDGTLVDSESWDAILLPGPARTGGDSLTSLLHAVPHEHVTKAVVTAVLASIAVSGDEQPWAAPDGRWAIGPARGRSGQEQASYIGATAREAARQRRLAVLDAQLAELTALISGLDGDLRLFNERLRTLAEEQRKQPTDTVVRGVLSELTAARKQDEQLSGELAKSAARLGTVKGALAQTVEALRAYAHAHLTPTTPDQIDTVNSALTDLHVAVERLVARIGTALLLADQHGDTEKRVRQREEDLDGLTEESAAAENRATALREELDEKTRLLGVGIQETLQRLDDARNELAEAAKESTTLTKRLRELGEKRGAFKQEVDTVAEEAGRLLDVRQAAVVEFQRARNRGFLTLIHVSDVDDQVTDDLAEATRVHALLAEEEFGETARNTARNDVDSQFRDLQREIEGPDWHPWGDNDGDLFVVQVTFNGADHSVPELRDLIAAEIETRSTFVQAKERKLYAEVLLGKVGEHLRQRRLDASRLVKEMDEQLKRHPTASKMRMSIDWKPAKNAGKQVHDAIKLLDRGSTNFLAEDARDALIEFLGEQVREARQRAEFGDWKTHLAEALDYRRWSEFELQVLFHDNPKPVELTGELHKKKSGGEKAAMLQLPMFAAAAAHYAGAAPISPRPIYLDEAFAGIDSEMRASCMGLLTGFDLDFVMASHDEWGFHTTVPGLMTYALRRDPEIFGVLATPIVWDGTRRHRLEDRSLKAGPAPSIFDTDEQE
ncbi:TIGR02680 family protein [Saccharopolyspora shandongensis]|uniref:TIGR02680 family protein n=1 Tax=Saccharopolyspora shandongensis TaxID=418495 RepID=UPI0033D97014